MSKILIVYGTTQGQTGRIAMHLKKEFMRASHVVDLFDSRKVSSSLNLNNYDAILVGASVHAGGYQRVLKKWVKDHRQELNFTPSAFFSVCLGILQKQDSVQKEEVRIVEKFLAECNWQPAKRIIFAGALPYTEYNPLLRWWMKRIAKKAGGDTDTSKDYEYTNWNDVNQFARDFSKDFHLIAHREKNRMEV